MYLIAFIAVASLIAIKMYNSVFASMCKCTDKMQNKVVIITGANAGIGFETAKDLASRGAKVILACRDEQRATVARDLIIQSTGNTNVFYKHLNLASFKSVRKFAEEILKSETQLDILINNAGTGNIGSFLTGDNIPIEPQANYFSAFLLTVLLLPLLKASAPSRIINVSSLMYLFGKIDVNKFHKQPAGYIESTRVYSNTKLANILLTRKLSADLRGTGVTANSLHPGVVYTDIFRDKYLLTKFLMRLCFKTAYEGAQTTIHLAVCKDLINVSGKYFSDCREKKTTASTKDDDVAEQLWKLSEKVVSWEKKFD